MRVWNVGATREREEANATCDTRNAETDVRTQSASVNSQTAERKCNVRRQGRESDAQNAYTTFTCKLQMQPATANAAYRGDVKKGSV